MAAFATLAPSFTYNMGSKVVQGVTSRSFGALDPSWRIYPAPSLETHLPTCNDNLVDSLRDGSIVSCVGIRRFTGDREIELDDGARLEADVVIFCTGFVPHDELVQSQNSVYKDPEDGSITTSSFPRLYQNIFPPEYADCLAYSGYWVTPTSILGMADLIAMAVAQVFKGGYQLPSIPEMNTQIDKHQAWVRSLRQKTTVDPCIVQGWYWKEFLHKVAGTRVDEYLGWGWKGWWFWLTNPRFCSMLMSKYDSAVSYRLFDGRRTKWEGAKEAIIEINKQIDWMQRHGVTM